MKLYKLTTEDMLTRKGFGNETKWEIGKPVCVNPERTGTSLCSQDVIHAYVHPVLALIMNSRHADIKEPRLFEAEGDIVVNDGTKSGVKELTLTKELSLPKLDTEKLIEFAIRCSLLVYKDEAYVKWAKGWLDGSDRSERTAHAVYAAYAADAYAASHADAYAAHADAYAAFAAAYAASHAAYAHAADAYAAKILEILNSVFGEY